MASSADGTMSRVSVMLLLAVMMFLNIFMILSNNPTFLPTLLENQASLVDRVEAGLQTFLGNCRKKKTIVFLKTHKV
jgi:hypothetical protein